MRSVIGFALPLVTLLAGILTAVLVTGRTETAAIIVLCTIALAYLVIAALSYRMGLRFGRKLRHGPDSTDDSSEVS